MGKQSILKMRRGYILVALGITSVICFLIFIQAPSIPTNELEDLKERLGVAESREEYAQIPSLKTDLRNQESLYPTNEQLEDLKHKFGVSLPREEYTKNPLLQNDSRVLHYIKTSGYLKPPSSGDFPYNLEEPAIDPSMGQSQIVKVLFNGKRNGFFVECGALDGETRSNTLSLERDYGWEGLLVEGDPKNYKLLLEKSRKAWSSGCCLAVHPYPHEVMFTQQFNIGKIQSDHEEDETSDLESTVKVQCFPLFSLLSAMGRETVDYFSLDVEGFEMDVLKTIPFDSINIRVLTVEFTHGKGGIEDLIFFMRTKGYRVVTFLTHHDNLANDIVFVRKDFLVRQKFPEIIRSEMVKHQV